MSESFIMRGCFLAKMSIIFSISIWISRWTWRKTKAVSLSCFMVLRKYVLSRRKTDIDRSQEQEVTQGWKNLKSNIYIGKYHSVDHRKKWPYAGWRSTFIPLPCFLPHVKLSIQILWLWKIILIQRKVILKLLLPVSGANNFRWQTNEAIECADIAVAEPIRNFGKQMVEKWDRHSLTIVFTDRICRHIASMLLNGDRPWFSGSCSHCFCKGNSLFVPRTVSKSYLFTESCDHYKKKRHFLGALKRIQLRSLQLFS